MAKSKSVETITHGGAKRVNIPTAETSHTATQADPDPAASPPNLTLQR